jgi:hypothetical protein
MMCWEGGGAGPGGQGRGGKGWRACTVQCVRRWEQRPRRGRHVSSMLAYGQQRRLLRYAVDGGCALPPWRSLSVGGDEGQVPFPLRQLAHVLDGGPHPRQATQVWEGGGGGGGGDQGPSLELRQHLLH